MVDDRFGHLVEHDGDGPDSGLDDTPRHSVHDAALLRLTQEGASGRGDGLCPLKPIAPHPGQHHRQRHRRQRRDDGDRRVLRQQAAEAFAVVSREQQVQAEARAEVQREGEQQPELECPSVNRIPSAARRSMFGVGILDRSGLFAT